LNILGKKIKLRAIEEDDLEKLHEWANEPEIWNMLVGWHFPYSRFSQKQWFLSLDKNLTHKVFAIETIEIKLIGTASFCDIDWKNNHAAIGLIIGAKEDRGKGIGSDVLMAMARYAFEELNFERLDTEIIEYNTPSMRCFEKCGWKEEGRRRHWFFRRGRYWDKIFTGLTKDDYFSYVNHSKYWD
jgi:RimJ/RimL family protein N-acetyltransferase